MGHIQQTGANPDGTMNLEITYGGLESPFAGIDATKSSGIYIKPNALAMSSGLAVTDGYLNSIFLNPRAILNMGILSLLQSPAYCIGAVQVNTVVTGPPNTISKASIGFIAVSLEGLLTVYEYRNGLIAPSTGTVSIDTNGVATNLSFYIVNGVVYITGLGLAAIYAYTPNPTGSSTLTLLTDYVGGAYLGELNGRLLCLCCDQIVGGVYSYLPFQVSWSAAEGAYGIWNPLVSGLVTGAGFNNLPDVADEITGFFSTGPTGYIIRKQGITEMTPLNSGIQPFDFNHMWASNTGIGSIYFNTISQYGSLGSFLSDTGIYTLGYGGVNTIQGSIWSLIIRELKKLFPLTSGTLLNQIQNIAGGLVPISINGEQALYYVLYIPGTDNYLFVGNVLTQDWFIIQGFTYPAVQNIKVQGISNAALFDNGTEVILPVVSGVFINQADQTEIVLYTIDDTSVLPQSLLFPFFVTTALNAYLPVEEVAMSRDITVNAIGMYVDVDAEGSDAISITPAIGTLAYGTLQFQNGQGQFKMSTQVNALFTGRYPQLNLDILTDNLASSAVRIYKIVMFCSYDPKQVNYANN
jgi:hypothetical protein